MPHKCVSHSAPLRGASLCSQSITPLGRSHPGLRPGRSVKNHPVCRVLDCGLDSALTAPLLRLGLEVCLGELAGGLVGLHCSVRVRVRFVLGNGQDLG